MAAREQRQDRGGTKPRYWGFWTRGKLDLLRKYLDAFTTASSIKVDERIYLDLFGGQPENRERYTGEVLDGSAKIALGTHNPPFTRLRFFEIEPYATRLRESLHPSHPGRDLEVIAGDCNSTVHKALASLRRSWWAPTFTFIDPNGPDVHWSTLEALARFKKPTTTKTEIWMLLAAGMFTRTLPVDGQVRVQDAHKLTAMYGTDHWRTIYDGRVAGELTPGQAREEYVNLMRWRLEQVLGYRTTHPLEIHNEGGHSIYHMIFATDSDAGDRIMTSLYNRAANEFPAMRQAARLRQERLRQEEAGVQSLFGADVGLPAAPIRSGERLYQHAPPWPPYERSSRPGQQREPMNWDPSRVPPANGGQTGITGVNDGEQPFPA
ncbi:MAG: three-Cys-motif partner protein TcmP [Acidimicrobiales bacterium]